MKTFSFTMLLMVLFVQGKAQTSRYKEEVFHGIKQTNDITYGVNATILYLGPFGQAIPEALVLDLYEPEGDTLCERPLIIVFHSGNFLPFPQNTSPVGTRKDSSVVEICRRLARSGYVVASADYRLGWNPATPDPTALTIGLINAAYRGVQDANTCIRFFKRTVAEQGNPFHIDSSRIVLLGDDTGGYLSLNAGALDRYSKITETDQFCIPPGDPNCFPMVVEYLSGDVEGKVYGVNTPAVPGFPFPPGDTLCYPNHTAYSSKFALSISLSGAVGDTSWIDPGQPPVIAVHTPYDLTTPYECGLVYIQYGDTFIPVIHVCGSYAVTSTAHFLGNQSTLGPPEYWDDFQIRVTETANARSGGIEGLLTIYGDTITDFNPWNYWDCATNINCEEGEADNPHMSYEKADRYLDTIFAYVLPRMFRALNLDQTDSDCIVLNADDLIREEVDVRVFPNPADDEITLATPSDFVIRGISVFDMKGTLVHAAEHVDDTNFKMDTRGFVPGIYVIRFQFDQGISTRRIIVQ